MADEVADLSSTTACKRLTRADQALDDGEATLLRKAVPKGVVTYRVFDAPFFGAADKLETILAETHTEPEVSGNVILVEIFC